MKELVIRDNMDEYLSVSKYINWNDHSILSKADKFKRLRLFMSLCVMK